jgi:hypothetical protein
MNLLCGILLLFLDDEAAFWVLEALLSHIMPAGYYSRSMDAAVADQSVFADLVLERLPHVHMHLRRLGVELRLISMEWFLCLFSSTFEPSAALRERAWQFCLPRVREQSPHECTLRAHLCQRHQHLARGVSCPASCTAELGAVHLVASARLDMRNAHMRFNRLCVCGMW